MRPLSQTCRRRNILTMVISLSAEIQSGVGGMNDMILLSSLRPGQKARVREIRIRGGMRRRLLDLGLTEGTAVECLGESPGGALSAFLIRGAVIALRRSDSRDILAEPLKEEEPTAEKGGRRPGNGGDGTWD